MTAAPLPDPFPAETPTAPPPAASVTPILRPLHLAENLEWQPGAAVLLFPDHAEADYCRPLLPEVVALAWSSLRQDVPAYDWSLLAGRSIFLFGALDRRGADATASLLRVLPTAVQLPAPSDWAHPNAPQRLTAPAAKWTQPEAQAWFAMETQLLEDRYEEVRRGDQRTVEQQQADAQQAEPVLDPQPGPFLNAPFRLLGYDSGQFFYLPTVTQQIISVAAREHVASTLQSLAPLHWWEQTFPGKQGVDVTAAREAMLRASEDAGLFTPTVIRGRGCWIDLPPRRNDVQPPARVVFHSGDQLSVGRTSYPLGALPTKFVYPRAQPLSLESAEPLDNRQSAKFAELCQALQWSAPLHGKLLAGWCMAAAVCGALEWRPHIWITGRSGTGKSWVVENVVNRFLEKFSISLLSSTSEAGMRQTIRSDAMPIVLDEAESEDEKSRQRFKSILDLVRQSSSESGGAIVKGTTTGTAMEFRVRSCFCFASIGVAAVARPDTSRITVLTLDRRADNAAQFEIVKSLARETVLLPGYAAALRARAISLALQIRENATVFKQAVSLKVGDSRTGDQIGALLAGAFALTSVRGIDLATAQGWVNAQNWEEFTPTETDMDETRAVNVLTQSLIRIETAKGPATVSIGELIQRYYRPAAGPDQRALDAEDLIRRGVKVSPSYIDISCSHPELGRIFKDTIWAGKWRHQFERVGGAGSGRASVRFGAAVNRAVRLNPTIFGCRALELAPDAED